MNKKQAEHDRTVLPRIQALLAQGRSRREIAEQLQHAGVPTARRGGKWTHIAVGRILDRADRTQPEEPSPPPPPTEPPPAPAPQLQKIEEQLGNTVDQLSARLQQSAEQLGNAVDQMGARLQNKVGTVESQVDERLTALNRLSSWLWLRPVAVGVAICLAVGGAGWGYVTWLKSSIENHREERGKLQVEIARQQATLRELEKQTWGVGFVEAETRKFITWPGRYKPPFKGVESDPTYAGKWVAELAEE